MKWLTNKCRESKAVTNIVAVVGVVLMIMIALW